MRTLQDLTDTLENLVKENPRHFPKGMPGFKIGIATNSEDREQEADNSWLKAPFSLHYGNDGQLMTFYPNAIRRHILLKGAEYVLRNASHEVLCQLCFRAKIETEWAVRFKMALLVRSLTPLYMRISGSTKYKVARFQNVCVWKLHDKTGATKFAQDNYGRVLPILSDILGIPEPLPA